MRGTMIHDGGIRWYQQLGESREDGELLTQSIYYTCFRIVLV